MVPFFIWPHKTVEFYSMCICTNAIDDSTTLIIYWFSAGGHRMPRSLTHYWEQHHREQLSSMRLRYNNVSNSLSTKVTLYDKYNFSFSCLTLRMVKTVGF